MERKFNTKQIETEVVCRSVTTAIQREYLRQPVTDLLREILPEEQAGMLIGWIEEAAEERVESEVLIVESGGTICQFLVDILPHVLEERVFRSLVEVAVTLYREEGSEDKDREADAAKYRDHILHSVAFALAKTKLKHLLSIDLQGEDAFEVAEKGLELTMKIGQTAKSIYESLKDGSWWAELEAEPEADEWADVIGEGGE
jgi:hypothetical protein